MSEPKTTLRFVAALKSDLARRLLALLVLALGTGGLVGEYAGEPVTNLKVGGVAERSVRATANFPFIDREATQERQRAAASLVKPVLTSTPRSVPAPRPASRIPLRWRAIASARSWTPRGPETDASIRADFEKMLDLALGTDALERLSSQRYSKEIEALVKTLVGAEIGRFTIAERSLLPSEERPISVIRILQDSRDEITLDGFSKIVTPEESRRAIKMAAFDVAPPDMSAEARMAAVAVAQAAVRTNFSYNQLLTEDRRRAARSDVLDVVIQVQRGNTIVREGEVVSEAQFETLSAMAEARGATARARSLPP